MSYLINASNTWRALTTRRNTPYYEDITPPNMSEELKCNTWEALGFNKGNVERKQIVNLMRITRSVGGK